MEKTKNKKQKGITLIALVITIIILIILAGVTILRLKGENGLLKRTEEAKVKNEHETIKEEITLKIMEISTEVMVNQHRMIKVEDLNKINNEKFTIENVSDFPVRVITEKYEYEINNKLEVSYVGKTNGLIVGYKLNTTEYTNQDIIITINATSTEGIVTIEEPQGIIKNEDGTYTVNENGTYLFKVTDSVGNEKTKEITINKIDKEKPEINAVESRTKTIVFEASDNFSGISGYAITTQTDIPEKYEKIEANVNVKKEIDGLVSDTQYYLWIKDEAGNISEYCSIKTKDESKVELYNYGEDNEDLTGGWKANVQNTGYCKFSKLEDCLYMHTTSRTYSLSTITTINKIDLTDYDWLCFDVINSSTLSSSYPAVVGISTINTSHEPSFTKKVQTTVTSELKNYKVDISSITGSYYPAIYGVMELKAYRIYLK